MTYKTFKEWVNLREENSINDQKKMMLQKKIAQSGIKISPQAKNIAQKNVLDTIQNLSKTSAQRSPNDFKKALDAQSVKSNKTIPNTIDPDDIKRARDSILSSIGIN